MSIAIKDIPEETWNKLREDYRDELNTMTSIEEDELNEEYRDTYMKARDFGDSLTMEKGEKIILSDSSVYNDPTLKPVIVDHYVNGKPCYPPDEDIEWLP